MSLLSELNDILAPLITIETGVFSDSPPDRYLVITPLADTYGTHVFDLTVMISLAEKTT